MSDKRISRAAHPIIHAWRCQVENAIHQGKLLFPTTPSHRCWIIHLDNGDNGESAAGGRLAHLLQILVCIYHCLFWHFVSIIQHFQEVKNVLVIVTRYFGGIHLGPDRFKHINQAARNALDLGGFLETSETRKGIGRGKKHWNKYSYKLWNILYIDSPPQSWLLGNISLWYKYINNRTRC